MVAYKKKCVHDFKMKKIKGGGDPLVRLFRERGMEKEKNSTDLSKLILPLSRAVNRGFSSVGPFWKPEPFSDK